MDREIFRHFFDDQIRWGDCDLLGHVNNTLYLRYIESARIAYSEELLDVNLNPSTKTGWVLADLHCSFRDQLTYPCRISVGSRISRVGNSSATMEAAVFAVEKDRAAFTSTAILVWYDFISQQTARIPDQVRQAVKTFEGTVEGL
ncbi:MAG: acyl-CoA thioesterase [Gammaproteobacteria bacterium]|nr:acyl-CoA thioesterase [Gammaproteobacteria bacterium]